jgi:hypothetical protein
MQSIHMVIRINADSSLSILQIAYRRTSPQVAILNRTNFLSKKRDHVPKPVRLLPLLINSESYDGGLGARSP